jgi:hypothetical protein
LRHEDAPDYRRDQGAPDRVLSRLVSERGAPTFLRSDNGPEFVSNALLSWIVAQGIACSCSTCAFLRSPAYRRAEATALKQRAMKRVGSRPTNGDCRDPWQGGRISPTMPT